MFEQYISTNYNTIIYVTNANIYEKTNTNLY